MGNWSQLPSDLIHQITDRLTLPDLIRFGSVCSPWKSLSSPAQHRGHLPWLILPLNNNSPDSGNIWLNSLYFYSILDKKFHSLDIPEMKERRICGSSNGWLITIHNNADIYLIHPFSRKVIELPSLNDVPGIHGIHLSRDNGLQYIISDNVGRSRGNARFENSNIVRDEYIVKAIVSPDLNVVFGILGGLRRLFFCRVETDDNEWIVIEDAKKARYMDVTFYKGQFYAVGSSGSVVVIDNSLLYTRKIIDGYDHSNKQLYLVESAGDLLKVIRFYDSLWKSGDDPIDEDVERTVGFKVLKLDFELREWVEVKNLGDRTLFLGFNHSSSISTSDFPGCKGNCIYFTDNCMEMYSGGNDKGVYNLEDRTIHAIYPDDSKEILPRPIWYSSIQGQF